jgi:hypothetical protein
MTRMMSERFVPVRVLVVLALLLPAGPLGWLATRSDAHSDPVSLAEIATRAGCRLREFEDGMRTNPPVGGRFRERNRVADGSYAGARPPSLAATTHALFHGRVLVQYRPGLPAADVRALEGLVRDKVVLFENQTGMSAPVAATAYLSVLTCPRFDRRTLAALAAFRDRRHAFGQAF